MHVAIIMDGNGRWAERRGLPRTAGHRAGARAVRRIVEAAAGAPEVDVLTHYAFSSDNWSRPAEEVASLMALFRRHLASEAARCVQNGVRLRVIGRRDRLAADLVHAIERAEHMTAGGERLELRLAVDYSARHAILGAANLDRESECSIEYFEDKLARAMHAGGPRPVDLLIRTGGERRLSDFLLWECAYAELVFVDRYWPDFDEAAFDSALREFANRDRRFGGVGAVIPCAAARGSSARTAESTRGWPRR
jgi:undecaprenyl diphosphate synthase